MQKRRVLSLLLSAFIICSTTCGRTFASGILTVDDMGIDPWGELEEIQGGLHPAETPDFISETEPIYALRSSPMAVMSAAVTSDTAAEWHIEKTGQQYFGFSTRYTGQWTSMGPVTKDVLNSSSLSSGAIRLATYTNSNNMKSTIAYQAPAEFYVDVYKDVNVSENDTAYIYVNGNPNLYFQVYNGYGSLMVEPTSIHVLVNDSEYVSDIEPGSVVRQEIPLGAEFPEITKAGFRFYFGVREAQKDVGTVSDKVYYQLLPRIGNMSITTSDQATGLLSGILTFLQTIYNAIVSLPSNIASAISGILQSLFVPSAEDITAIKSNYEELFSTRLGFIYQGCQWVINFATTILNTLQNVVSYSFDFPGVAVPLNGTTYQIIPAMTVSLDNAVMDILRPCLGTIVSFICISAWLDRTYLMIMALFSGYTYMDYLAQMRGRKS